MKAKGRTRTNKHEDRAIALAVQALRSLVRERGVWKEGGAQLVSSSSSRRRAGQKKKEKKEMRRQEASKETCVCACSPACPAHPSGL